MGVHRGGTSVAPSQLRTPTQPEIPVVDCGRVLTPTAIGRSPMVFLGAADFKVCRRAVRLGVPLRHVDADNNPTDRKCLVLAQAM